MYVLEDWTVENKAMLSNPLPYTPRKGTLALENNIDSYFSDMGQDQTHLVVETGCYITVWVMVSVNP